MNKELISLDYSNCLSRKVGDGNGINPGEIAAQVDTMKAALKQFDQWRASEKYGFFDLPLKMDQVSDVAKVLERLPREVDTLLHIGIGGSSLGPIAIQQALDNSLRPKEPSRFRSIVIQENVDPEGFALRLADLDLKRTAINVVSKSGGTIETLACLTAALDHMKKYFSEDEIGKRLIVCTENQEGVLASIGKQFNAHMITLPHNVGGRFSVLTAVGLLPAIAMGLDAEVLLQGANAMRQRCLGAETPEDDCFLYAFLMKYFRDKKRNINVLFPYSEMLRGLALWCCQLLGESLGKKVNRARERVHVGMTPTVSVGSVDQHSLLQLYMEGPADKFFTFFRVNSFRSEEPLANLRHSKLDTSHTQNLQMGAVINAEQTGTAEALAAEGRPSVTINIPEISLFTLGQLFYFFEFTTAYAAELDNIDAFDQPGVEASKILTLKYLRGES